MSNPHSFEIAVIADELEALGLDGAELRGLQREIRIVAEPSGLGVPVSTTVQDIADSQWRYVVGELSQSLSSVEVIARSIAGDTDISEQDRVAFRTRLVEMFKVVPAGLLAVAVEAVPFPGEHRLTPQVLAELNLMPLLWREAHLFEALRREAEKLREGAHPELAIRVDELRQALSYEAIARENIAVAATLQTFWDANGNGKWDREEREAYDDCLADLRSRRDRSGDSRRWYVSYLGAINGPLRLTDMVGRDFQVDLLVCFDGKTGWVDFRELVASTPPVTRVYED